MRVAFAGLAAGLLLSTQAALACGESLGAAVRRLGDATTQLVYKTVPAVPAVGRHFELEIAVCSRDKAFALAALRVDAHMPEHKHGMNYEPSVSSRGTGLYHAEGLMFHMPGRWELVFELLDGMGAVQRLTQTLAID